MTEYYFEDFGSYSEIFRQHAVYMAEMMKTLDDEIIGNGLPPVGRAKELFRMTLDLTYHADQSYRKKFNIEESDFKLTTYMSQDEVISSMRTALKDEFDRFLDAGNGNK